MLSDKSNQENNRATVQFVYEGTLIKLIAFQKMTIFLKFFEQQNVFTKEMFWSSLEGRCQNRGYEGRRWILAHLLVLTQYIL